jgi:hypothetical protein
VNASQRITLVVFGRKAKKLAEDLGVIPLLSLSAENNPGCLEHKTFIKKLDFRHSVRK